jgi:hypothetical protein
MWAGLSPEAFEALYVDPVPVRAGPEFLEVPELATVVEGLVTSELHWRMRRLSSTGTSFEADEAFAISFCRSYRFTWSAATLDGETIHVTREGTGCGPGDGESRIDDNRLDVEYQLVDPCEPPCAFVDERETILPGSELEGAILRDSWCEC